MHFNQFSLSKLHIHSIVDNLEKPGLDPTHPSNLQAVSLWESTYSEPFLSNLDSSARWDIMNDFCCETLLKNGGPRFRVSFPGFRPNNFVLGRLNL